MNVNINKKQQIIVPHGMTREIARTVGCSERLVHSALRGQTSGKKSIAARDLAERKLKELIKKWQESQK